jgi:hypothetical protein
MSEFSGKLHFLQMEFLQNVVTVKRKKMSRLVFVVIGRTSLIL